jgi:hypothetical protein
VELSGSKWGVKQRAGMREHLRRRADEKTKEKVIEG